MSQKAKRSAGEQITKDDVSDEEDGEGKAAGTYLHLHIGLFISCFNTCEINDLYQPIESLFTSHHITSTGTFAKASAEELATRKRVKAKTSTSKGSSSSGERPSMLYLF